MTTPSAKFETEELPKIHAALLTAHTEKRKCRVVVEFDQNGGVLGVILESKQTFK